MYAIYHSNCPDGFTAFMVLYKHVGGNVKGIPAGYSKLPDVSDIAPESLVYILDYSVKRATLEALLLKSCNVILLDHHESTFRELKDYPAHKSFYNFSDQAFSGAMLTWRFLNGPEVAAPLLVEYVQDYDLWKFQRPWSEQINAAIQSYDFTVQSYEDLWSGIETSNGYDKLLLEGTAIERKLNKLSSTIIASTKRWIVIGGHRVPIANAPYELASKTATNLSKLHKDEAPFAATYFDNSEGRRVFNLRTINDDIKVNEVAEFFGGGGHPKASAFSVGNDSYLRSI